MLRSTCRLANLQRRGLDPSTLVGRVLFASSNEVPVESRSSSPHTTTLFASPSQSHTQFRKNAVQFHSIRFFSAPTADHRERTFDTTAEEQQPSVEDALEKLFQESQQQLSNAPGDAWFSSAAAADAASSTTAVAVAAWEPTWYNLADQAIVAVNAFHDVSGLEYGWAIVGVTVVLRMALFPLMIMTQQTTARMAHLQPELALMKERYEAIGTPSRQDQLQFSKQMKSLFTKYQVKPFRAFLAPVVQFPCFMGMFFGLKKMPHLFPDQLVHGGMLWFPDLTAADPYCILPLASSLTFLATIEMSKDQMMARDATQGKLMLNVFRVMAVAMFPVCITFESAMLCYWTANNLLTLTQTGLLKADAVRKYFNIWDPPKPVPGMEPEGFTQAVGKLMKRIKGEATSDKQKMERHNQAVEVKKRARAFQMTRRNKAPR